MITQEISTRAGYVLSDPDAIRWTPVERELWINDGIRELLGAVPSAYVKHATVRLAPGEVQSVPADCRKLMEIRVSQMQGAYGWKCPRLVSREMLSLVRPAWMNKIGDGDVREYFYDPGDPERFYVYPPQPDEPGEVELIYQAVPPWVALGDVFPLREDYAMAVLNYVLYRAYSKDAEFAGNAQIALTYYQGFKAALPGAAPVS